MLLRFIQYRFSSFYPKGFSLDAVKKFYAKDLTIEKTNAQKQLPQFSPKVLKFGRYSTDHMLTVSSANGDWGKPKIIPYQPLCLDPFNSSLHYGIQCFQGLKAYKNEKGQLRLFRPDCNMKRFKASSCRISLPDFDGNQLIKCIQELVKLETRWIPPITQFSLYLRPIHISMQDALGVKAATKSQLLVLASPAGPYYQTIFDPISLQCNSQVIRSAHGGTGGYKVGGNYAPTLKPTDEAIKKKHQQVVWLYKNNGQEQIVEVGASNIFFVCKGSSPNKKLILTPSLQDLILPGVTRDSILVLLKNHEQFEVQQRIVTVKEVMKRYQEGSLLQIFGCGTAVIVSAVKSLTYKDKTLQFPMNARNGKAGQVTYWIRNQILNIQEGRKKDNNGWSRLIN